MEEKYLTIAALVVLVAAVSGFALIEMPNLSTPGNLTTNDSGIVANETEIPGLQATMTAVPTLQSTTQENTTLNITPAITVTANATLTTNVTGNVTVNATATTTSGGGNSGSDSSDFDSTHRTITDMAGRTVTIPSTISKVLCTSPPPTTAVYMLAPDKLGGWQFSATDEGMKYIPEKYRDIPVIGWRPINYETYIAQKPDLVFVLFEAGSDPSSVDDVQEKFGSIPVVCVDDARNATAYEETLRFMGDVLGVPDVAETEITYYQDVLDEVQSEVSAIPDADRVRVYYAEGNDGLKTDPSGSYHSQLIDVCGGINVADCAVTAGSGMTAVTKESVLSWSPDVIITTSSTFYDSVYDDDFWKQIPAVQNHQVYLAPSLPFNWFDRPPGVNRIVGIPWTAHILYPDRFSQEWAGDKEKEFYSTFYHYDLSDDELKELDVTSWRTITDMAGRTVTIPSPVSKVIAACPPPAIATYMVAPDKLGAWTAKLFSDDDMKFIPEKYQELPVLGWKPIPYEAYIAQDPDLVLVDESVIPLTDGSVDEVQEKFGSIPVVCVENQRDITNNADGLAFIGDVLQASTEADDKVAYTNEVLNEVETKVSTIPDADRVRVYYAEGNDGLKTDPSGSYHSQLIDICGGINVAQCEVSPNVAGMTAVTKESVLSWNPDVIITTNSAFYNAVFTDDSWNKTTAVNTSQVYLAPTQPINWFDRPGGVSRIVGIPWTAHLLYPDQFSKEWADEKEKEFYSTFYHYDLSDDELASLLSP